MKKRNISESCCPPAQSRTDILSAEEGVELLARYAKALGHPARVLILKKLIGTDGCIAGDLVDELPLAQSTVSQHLKQLKSAGLIRGEVDGPRICYCVEPEAVDFLKELVRSL